MKPNIFLHAVAVLALAATAQSAKAQLVEVGAAVRISDRAAANVRYSNRPNPADRYSRPYIYEWNGRRVDLGRSYRSRGRRAYQRFLLELQIEHDRLHYDMQFMRRKRAARLHRRWHRDVGFNHAWFRHEAWREAPRARDRSPRSRGRGRK